MDWVRVSSVVLVLACFGGDAVADAGVSRSVQGYSWADVLETRYDPAAIQASIDRRLSASGDGTDGRTRSVIPWSRPFEVEYDVAGVSARVSGIGNGAVCSCPIVLPDWAERSMSFESWQGVVLAEPYRPPVVVLAERSRRPPVGSLPELSLEHFEWDCRFDGGGVGEVVASEAWDFGDFGQGPVWDGGGGAE